ncbi:MAG: GyaR protein [Eubacterium sp.]|nr:GyaR protein [Eubacterium sp.]MDE6155976.1 GyaR protein [Eubacterium sp.]MDE6767436.1 GyaR protein [Eubacterium sp.]
MNITFYSNVTTEESALKYIPQLSNHNVKFIKLADRDLLINTAADTQLLMVDAMGKVDKKMIDALPVLKLIHSEGVGYQGVDVDYAAQKGIAVCNNKGVNDTAVAEDTLLLMLACLKRMITGHQSVYDGRQIEVKKAAFGVIRELSQCTVGLIGFGDIARATAKFCNALGARVLYTNRTRYEYLENEYNVTYCTVDKLLAQADFVSLHVAVTDDTREMVDDAFLRKMKKDAFLINTSRGDLVNNESLLNALFNDEIAGAGLDVISPEPVESDNILLDDRIKDKLILTPHIAGITNLTVQKIYKNIWENITNYIDGKPLKNRVN